MWLSVILEAYFLQKDILITFPGRFVNAFCLNIHAWASESDSCEETEPVSSHWTCSEMQSLAQQDDRHRWIYCPSDHQVLVAAPCQNIHTCLHAYISTNGLCHICINIGQNLLPLCSNHVSALQLPKTAPEHWFQQWYIVWLWKEVLLCLRWHHRITES